MGDEQRHPLLVDTSSLIALANTDQWDVAAENLTLTTTNVCKQELQQHVESNAHPQPGSRAAYLKNGSQRILDQLAAESSTFTCVTVVPRPHGPDAGEESLKRELSAHPDAYQVISLLDSAARHSLRRRVSDEGYNIDVVGPPYLLYVLCDTGLLSKREFCEATVEMIRTEGWTGYEVVKNAWASIPVDCANILDDEYDDVLPPK